MPELHGIEKSNLVQKMINEKYIPYLDIIALTANIAIVEEKICKEAGMNYYLKKPLRINDFSLMYKKYFLLYLLYIYI